MREIYHEADQVHVHLNVSDENVAHFAPLRQDLHLLSRASSSTFAIDLGEEGIGFEAWTEAQIWESVTAIFTHAWWSRAWVYQEFIVAQIGCRLCLDQNPGYLGPR